VAGPALAQDAMQWTLTRSIADTSLQTLIALTYGIPETDAAQAQVLCAIGANWIYADMTWAADIEGAETGTPMELLVSGNRYDGRIGASAARADEGIWGLRFAVPLDDPLWAAMAGPLPLLYGAEGQAFASLPPAPVAMLAAFRDDCLRIGDLSPSE
jgi:hypothetical protein